MLFSDALDSLLVSEVLLDPKQRAAEAASRGGQHFTDRTTKRIARNIASEMGDDDDDGGGYYARPGDEPTITVKNHFFTFLILSDSMCVGQCRSRRNPPRSTAAALPLAPFPPFPITQDNLGVREAPGDSHTKGAAPCRREPTSSR